MMNHKRLNTHNTYRYILAFGSNLGDRRKNCLLGLTTLLKSCTLINRSSLIKTKPLISDKYDAIEQDNFINMVCDIESKNLPSELYSDIVEIEDQIGHKRTKKWLPRKLDIDILLWAKNSHKTFSKCKPLSFNHNSLRVPHSDLLSREFLIRLIESQLDIKKSEILRLAEGKNSFLTVKP